MNVVRGVFALAVIMTLAACSVKNSYTVEKLNRAEAVGSPFTKLLATEYRSMADGLDDRFFHHGNTLYFARKGLAAADGVIVMPETLNNWDLNDEALIAATQARADLVDALESGGREIAPLAAAAAQINFDCWVAAQARATSGLSCKDRFYAALQDLKTTVASYNSAPAAPPAMAVAPVVEEFPAPVNGSGSGPAVPIQQATFLAFFDWDKYNLSSGAMDVLTAVAKEVKDREDLKQVVIVGHTDTSGSERYNDRLSMKRARAVRDYLVSQGLPADKMRLEARGEKDLLVKTSDNVREAENRRAQITLE